MAAFAEYDDLDATPVGCASHGREDVLIRVAAALELAAPWHHRRPPH